MALFYKGMIPWNKKEQIKKECRYCGKVFFVKASLERVKSCSTRCARSGIIGNRIGTKTSIETKLKQRIAKLGIRGKSHWNYRGYKNKDERDVLMSQDEYIQWRKKIFERDNYTCQHCGKRGCYLEADHIKSWLLYPELRYNLNNGRTLCRPCHQNTDTWGGRSKLVQVGG